MSRASVALSKRTADACRPSSSSQRTFSPLRTLRVLTTASRPLLLLMLIVPIRLPLLHHAKVNLITLFVGRLVFIDGRRLLKSDELHLRRRADRQKHVAVGAEQQK